jgi:hypothetical protein
MRPLLAALGLFASLLAALSILWTLMLGVAMGRVWGLLPEAASPWVGVGVLAFAIVRARPLRRALARALRALGVGNDRVTPTSSRPARPAGRDGARAGAALARMRIGW